MMRRLMLGRNVVVCLSLTILTCLYCSIQHWSQHHWMMIWPGDATVTKTAKHSNSNVSLSSLPNDTINNNNNVSSTLLLDRPTMTTTAFIADAEPYSSNKNNNKSLSSGNILHEPLLLLDNKVQQLSLEQPNGTYSLARNVTKHHQPTESFAWSKIDSTTTTTHHANMVAPTTQSLASPLISDKNVIDHHPSMIPPLCTREEIRLGEWVPITMPEIPYVPQNLRCLPNKAYTTGKPWNTWEWQPFAAQTDNCTFSKWNASQFCSLTRHATVAIVGDSLSWEQYASLAQLLGQPVSEKMNIRSHNLGKWVIHTVCQKQTRLVFLRDDVLARVALVVNATFPNVLVLNRGAHYTPDLELEADLQRFVVPHVQAWQESCRTSKRPCHLFVRTTVPGHFHCASFTQPYKSVQRMERHIAKRKKYHWNHFQRQNLLSLGVYQQANLTFEVLDGYDINILRPDDHFKPADNEDCLHSCYPGKMDVYNQLLLHFLQDRGGVAEDATAMDSWGMIDPSNVLS